MKVVFTCVCECARVIFLFVSYIPLISSPSPPLSSPSSSFLSFRYPCSCSSTIIGVIYGHGDFSSLFPYYSYFFVATAVATDVGTALRRRWWWWWWWWEFGPDEATVRGQQQHQVRFRTHQSDLSVRAVMPAGEHITSSTSSSGPQPSSAAVRE